MQPTKRKQICLTNNNTVYTLNSAYDLYILYNDWLQDILDRGYGECLGTVEKIREEYTLIWTSVSEGTYTLKEFETWALKIIQ